MRQRGVKERGIVGRDSDAHARIGKPRRSEVLAALLAAAVALAAAVPFVGLGLAVLWSWLARTVDTSMTSTVCRRHQSGRRRSDGVVAAMASPWHLLVSAMSTLLSLLLPLAFALLATLAARVADYAASLPPSVDIVVGGTVESSAESQAPIAAVVPVMLLIMATLVMIQMQSFRLSLIVFAAAPLGLIGVVAALLLQMTAMVLVRRLTTGLQR